MNWNFNTTYLNLPEQLFSLAKPTPAVSPKLVLFNDQLAEQLGLTSTKADNSLISETLSGNKLPNGAIPFAQAYAGHQFGHFTMLGDGRAIMLGEHITPDGKRYDIQLKGSGITPYSRRGDGKATQSAMLREYCISEAMFHLNIPTTRSLCVISTGENVYREDVHEGAILTRVAASHIRVGTFEYISNFHSAELLRKFTEYTVQRHFPELKDKDNIALSLLNKVMELQIELIVNWMRVGFIHGVMNTDNMSISGETIDYGPCAFMNAYNPNTVFSSIDSYGRYAFENQPSIALWNLSCLAGALLPIIDTDKKLAIKQAENVLDKFKPVFETKWREMMCKKLGFADYDKDDLTLISELLNWMEENKADYTNTFMYLSQPDFKPNGIYENESFTVWFNKWKERTGAKERINRLSLETMQSYNPAYIPRNHLVEKALKEATEDHSMNFLNTLNSILKHPYNYQNINKVFQKPPDTDDRFYKTYCGT